MTSGAARNASRVRVLRQRRGDRLADRATAGRGLWPPRRAGAAPMRLAEPQPRHPAQRAVAELVGRRDRPPHTLGGLARPIERQQRPAGSSQPLARFFRTPFVVASRAASSAWRSAVSPSPRASASSAAATGSGSGSATGRTRCRRSPARRRAGAGRRVGAPRPNRRSPGSAASSARPRWRRRRRPLGRRPAPARPRPAPSRGRRARRGASPSC